MVFEASVLEPLLVSLDVSVLPDDGEASVLVVSDPFEPDCLPVFASDVPEPAVAPGCGAFVSSCVTGPPTIAPVNGCQDVDDQGSTSSSTAVAGDGASGLSHSGWRMVFAPATTSLVLKMPPTPSDMVIMVWHRWDGLRGRIL